MWSRVMPRCSVQMCSSTGADMSFGFMPYGNWWRRHRRAFWQHFRPQAVVNHYPAQQPMATRFLAKLLEDPSRFQGHIR